MIAPAQRASTEAMVLPCRIARSGVAGETFADGRSDVVLRERRRRRAARTDGRPIGQCVRVNLDRSVQTLVALVAAGTLAACVGGCASNVPSASVKQDHARADARICDAFIREHGGHFSASGPIDIPNRLQDNRRMTTTMEADLQTFREFNGGAQCAVFTAGSDLRVAQGCASALGEFLVMPDASRYVSWPCPHG
jgi:hypothetical protein